MTVFNKYETCELSELKGLFIEKPHPQGRLTRRDYPRCQTQRDKFSPRQFRRPETRR